MVEKETEEGRELFLLTEKGWRQRGEYRKSTLPESSWREKERVETPIRNLTRKEERRKEKGERRKEKGEGLNTIKTINRGAHSLKLHSSTPGRALVGRANPQEQTARSEGSSGHTGRGGFTAERTFDRGCVASPQAKVPWAPENNHVCWCWNKDFNGVAWKQICIVSYHNPRTLLLHDHANFFWGGLAPSCGLWESVAAQSCECSWGQQTST